MKADQYKEDTEHYLYDIFVCYSQADRQWVFEHLVARLEDGGRYVCCARGMGCVGRGEGQVTRGDHCATPGRDPHTL